MSQPTQAQLEPDVLHAEAVKAMLAPTGYPVYLSSGEIPARLGDDAFPYLCAWAAPGEPTPGGERLAGYDGAIVTRHQITIAALTALDVIGAAARARRLLHRRRPTIPGRRCGDMNQIPGPPAVPVVDTGVPGPNGQRIHVGYLLYQLSSTPAN